MAQAIGVVSGSEGAVTAVGLDGHVRTIGSGDQIFEGEVVATQGAGSSLGITFNNGCQMALGEGETALIDETAYKLEFFDNADVVVDLEGQEGISKEVAADEEESGDEAYVVQSDGVIDDAELDAMETAAGGFIESSQVDEAEIAERIEAENTHTQGSNFNAYEADYVNHTISPTQVERGGTQPLDATVIENVDVTAPDAPIVAPLELINNVSPTIHGTAEAGSSVTVFDGETELGSVIVSADGSWTLSTQDLDDGSHNITAIATDSAGNVSDTSIAQAFVVDTTPPDAPIVEMPNLTNLSTPTINGSAEAGDTITINVGDDTFTTQADSEGNWTITLEPLLDGNYVVSVVVTDNAGNVSQSVTGNIIIDQTVPDTPIINPLDLSNDATPTISGSAEAGSSVTVSVSGEEYAAIADTEGNWSVTTTNLNDGNYSVTATATDSAGNISGNAITQTFVIDTTAPETPVIADMDVNSLGVVLMSGVAEAGSHVSVSVGDEIFTALTSDTGAWSLTTSALGVGDHLFTVLATDEAGNSSQSATASILVDPSSVSYTINYEASGSEGTTHSIEDTTLYGITREGGFDRNATTLDLDNARTDDVSSHIKGYGIEGGGRGEDRSIQADEALVIRLDAPVDSIDISINKLAFFEGGHWIAYDENMQRVGENSFSFFDSFLGRDHSYETSFWGNNGELSISSDNVDGNFQYLVFTTDDNWQGNISSYFVEDVSYETTNAYVYDLTIENVPMDDTPTTLHIEGLDAGLQLEDGAGNSVGSYEDGVWTLGENEINDLGTINGTLNLQIVSDTVLSPGTLTPTFTITETTFDTSDSGITDSLSPLTSSTQVLDFDNLDDVQRIDLSENEINVKSLNLHDVMELSDGSNRLEIVSGEHDNHVLTLDASDWVVKTDAAGNDVSLESDGNAYNVYTSTSAEHSYDLLVDEMITVVLGNQ